MTLSEALPSSGALEEVRRLAGPSAVVLGAVRLEGAQHADTWRVDTENPAISVVVRQFPVDDPAPLREQRVLRALDGLGGLAPMPLGGDPHGRWSQHPTSLISWLDVGRTSLRLIPRGGRASWVARSPRYTRRRPSGWRNCQACSTAAEALRRYWLVHWRRKFGLAGHRLFRRRRCSPTAITGRATSSGDTKDSRASSTGWPGHAVRAVPTRSRPSVRRANCRRLPRGLRGEHRSGGRRDAPLGLLGRRPVRGRSWVLGTELPTARTRRPRRG